MPERIQRRRSAGWRMPANAVYVGHPSRWKNPYKIVPVAGRPPYVASVDKWGYEQGDRWSGFRSDYEAALFAVDLFHRMLLGAFEREPRTRKHCLAELAGKDLVCWCPLDQACHADVLLHLANEAVSR